MRANPSLSATKPKGKHPLKKALEQIALLLGAATLVTLLSQALDLSVQKTAIYSLATMLLVSCCMYKQWINKRLPSALLLGVLFGLAAIFFFNFQNILLKDTGLVRRFRDPDEILSEVGKQIDGARHEIWLFGVNFYKTPVDRRKALLERLKEGVTIRCLILDPFYTNIQQVATDFDQPVTEINDECAKGVRNLLFLREQWNQIASTTSRPGELQIEFYQSTPRARMYVFDPALESGHTILIPYMNRVESAKLPGYLLQNTKTGVYESYFGGVQKLWTESEPVDAWLKRHPEFGLMVSTKTASK